jgi:hypothetical protein
VSNTPIVRTIGWLTQSRSCVTVVDTRGGAIRHQAARPRVRHPLTPLPLEWAMTEQPIGGEEAAGYVEHVLSCDDKLCGRFAHRWVKTDAGLGALRGAMRAERDREEVRP